MKKDFPPISIVRARQLRRESTEEEKIMRRLLREHFAQARFRHQVPIRKFIVDFASHRFRLIIEIDGGQHSVDNDAKRTSVIEAQGYRIIRFWNNEVRKNTEGCIIKLAQALEEAHPHPAATRRQAAKSSRPSPIEGEGRT